MRLLNTSTLQLKEFEANIPPYAILSHRWGKEEVTFHQFHQPDAVKLTGYTKLLGACNQAQKEGVDYIWIDTCCIDKSSSAELTESINSMFNWYQDAVVCYAYLVDVPSNVALTSDDGMGTFVASQWWTRGWTLQELLAPPILQFFGSDWGNPLGSKRSLSPTIADITGIPEPILIGQAKLLDCSIAMRMSWASLRETSRKEDIDTVYWEFSPSTCRYCMERQTEHSFTFKKKS
jgi:hypothetical protein